MNNNLHVFPNNPVNPLAATPPGSPNVLPPATPQGSPSTPTGAAHVILQAAGGLGALAAVFPGLAPINVAHPFSVLAPGTPIAGAAANGGPMNLIPHVTPPRDDVPPTPRAGARHGGAFRGSLLPLFNRAARQADIADIQPTTPTNGDGPQPGVGSLPGGSADGGSPGPAPTGAGPSNWWQR